MSRRTDALYFYPRLCNNCRFAAPIMQSRFYWCSELKSDVDHTGCCPRHKRQVYLESAAKAEFKGTGRCTCGNPVYKETAVCEECMKDYLEVNPPVTW